MYAASGQEFHRAEPAALIAQQQIARWLPGPRLRPPSADIDVTVRSSRAVHFHCCVTDGVFAVGEDGQVHFAEAGALTPEDLAAVQQQVRARVLRWVRPLRWGQPTGNRAPTGRFRALSSNS